MAGAPWRLGSKAVRKFALARLRILFLVSFFFHGVGGSAEYNEEQACMASLV